MQNTDLLTSDRPSHSSGDRASKTPRRNLATSFSLLNWHSPLVLGLAILPLLATSCTLTGDSAWNGIHASGSLGYQQTSIGGGVTTNTEVSPGVVVSSDFDFEDQGGQDRSKPGVFASATVGLAPLELRLSGFEYQQTSSGTFTGDFLDTTFTGAIDTDFDILVYKATLGFDFINLERFRVGAIVGATVFDFDIFLSSPDVPTEQESLDELFPAPVVGARGDVKITDTLRVGGEFSLLPLEEVEGFEVGYVDWQAGVFLEPISHVELFAIYRSISLEVDGEIEDADADVDLQFTGPVIGAAITF